MRRAGADVVVRINQPAVARGAAISSLDLPGRRRHRRHQGAQRLHIRLLDEHITELEAEARPAGRPHPAHRDDRNAGRILSDATRSLRASPRTRRDEHRRRGLRAGRRAWSPARRRCYPKQHMIFAARAAGIMPLGFIDSVARLRRLGRVRTMVRRSRQFGFMGAGCIHPGQVPIVNEEYSPSADEVEYARSIVKKTRSSRRGPRLVVARRQDDRHSDYRARAKTYQAL